MLGTVREHANEALRRAEDEAQAMGHRTVETEHVLLGLRLDSRGIAGRVLADSGVSSEQVRDLVRERLGASRRRVVKRRCSFSTEAKGTLALAKQIALGIREPLGTQHLLVALAERTESGACHILRALDVDPRVLGSTVKRLTWPLHDREAGPYVRHVGSEPVTST